MELLRYYLMFVFRVCSCDLYDTASHLSEKGYFYHECERIWTKLCEEKFKWTGEKERCNQ